MSDGGGKKRFIIEPHSPHYLHPSEGPGAIIMTFVFDGKNYDLWERAVRTALKAKNKLAFIDGSLTRPAAKEDEEFSECHAWDMLKFHVMFMAIERHRPEALNDYSIYGDRSSNVE